MIEITSHCVIRAALMEIQGGACAICRATGRLFIDHDHETGLARGLLCGRCNTREGHAESGLFRTVADEAMLAYLANPPAAGRGWVYDLPDRNLPSMEEAAAALMAITLPPIGEAS